ncbi:serpin-ZX-like [Punica granatum]|uniref:Serpin-ZX-like n=1 Tax=Punica granatum TaxID=22663 RepID=A0A6P8EEX0_PUNGR|nr:serpin-ZX-like [Punica granatum]
MSQVGNRNSSAVKRARTNGGQGKDDWTCPSCGNVNFPYRKTCNRRNCTKSRPADRSRSGTNWARPHAAIHREMLGMASKRAMPRVAIDAEMQGMARNQVEIAMRLSWEAFSGTRQSAVFSPLSIQLVLGMVAAGMRESERENLLQFLGGRSTETLSRFASEVVERVFEDSSPVGGPKLSVAYGAWIERTMTLKPAFKRMVEEEYKAAAKLVDFKNKPSEVVNQVNKWVKKETNGLIDRVVSPRDITTLTMLVLANALYFKGAWVEKFD